MAPLPPGTSKPGDAVKRDELIVDIETDKVVLEVLATADGVLGDIVKGEGDNRPVRDCIELLDARSLKAVLPQLLPRRGRSCCWLRLPLPPMLAKMTRLPPRPPASWLKKTASTWLPLPVPVKAVASPRKTWLLLLPSKKSAPAAAPAAKPAACCCPGCRRRWRPHRRSACR